MMEVLRAVFHRKNGNHVPNPWRYNPPLEPPKLQAPAPVHVEWPPELTALLVNIKSDLEENDKRLTRLASDLSENISEAMARFYTKIKSDLEPLEPVVPPELTTGLERVTDRLEMLLQMPQPEPPDLDPVVERLEALVAAMPRQTPELAETLSELPHKIGELFAAARQGGKSALSLESKSGGGGSGNPPPKPQRDLPRMNPSELPTTPSIPAPYVPGTVTVPGGQVWNLLYLIQKQLSPNCPGSSVEFSLSTDDEILVGGASILGGPLSETNYAYKLTADNSPRTYRSTYPGGNTPVGEIQVFATVDGSLHVEVQA